MLFWLFVTLVVLLIAYRKQIYARYERYLEKVSRNAERGSMLSEKVSFDIPIDEQDCPGIRDFLARMASPGGYVSMLMSADLGILDRDCVVDANSTWGGRKSDDDDVRSIKLSLNPKVESREIAKLEGMAETERGAYVANLIRDDMAYRREHRSLIW